MTGSLGDKTLFITGASRGIGLAIGLREMAQESQSPLKAQVKTQKSPELSIRRQN